MYPVRWKTFILALLMGLCAGLLLAGCAGLPEAVQEARAGVQYVPEPGLEGDINVFAADDGAQLAYVSYTHGATDTALVYLHGIESHAGWFAKAANLLRDRGYDVYSLDRRGSGLNRENRGLTSGFVESYDVLFDDIQTVIASLRQRYDRLILVGLSWGGKLALAYGLHRPEDIDGLVLITPGIRSLVDVSLMTKLNIFLSTRLQPKAAIAVPIESQMFTTTPVYLDYIERDPLRLRQATARFFYESHKLDKFVDRYIEGNKLPIQLYLAGNDRIIDNAGVAQVVNMGAPGTVDTVTYDDQTHSIQLDAAERLVADMDRWIKQR